jgi:hypothetical protein
VAPLLAAASARPFSARVMGSAEYPARCGLRLPRRAATAKNMHRLRALRLERDEKGQGKVNDLNSTDY